MEKNDWPTIALSVVIGRDMRDYLYAWGLTGSQKAQDQVAALNLPHEKGLLQNRWASFL